MSKEKKNFYVGLGNKQQQQQPTSRHHQNSIFGKTGSIGNNNRYISDLGVTTTSLNKAREQELNDEGFEETQSLVSESLSQEASSGNYETDVNDSTNCSPASRLGTGIVSKTLKPINGTSATTIDSSTTTNNRQALRNQNNGRTTRSSSIISDKSLSRVKGSYERRDSQNSVSSRASSGNQDTTSLNGYSTKRIGGNLKREVPPGTAR